MIKIWKKISIISDKKKEIVGCFVSEIFEKKTKRKLDILEGKATAIHADDFKMTEEEFLGL
jgi:hypothetical protein